jgi:predicted transcriptional regulator
MDLLEIINASLAGRNTVEIKRLAAMAGVAWSTVYKIASGTATNPRWSTVTSLGRALGVAQPRLTAADRKRLFKNLSPRKHVSRR